jgi:hypothetical protein
VSEGLAANHPLRLALENCGVAGQSIPAIARQLLLFRPVYKVARGAFDKDIAARLLRLNNGTPDAKVKWSSLSYPERKQAKSLWSTIGRNRIEHYNAKRPPTSIGPSRSGRPTVIDPALLLFCMRVLSEAKGAITFELGHKFERETSKHIPSGTMWQALLAVFPLAQSFVAIRSGVEPIAPVIIHKHADGITIEQNIKLIHKHTDAIEQNIKLARSKTFEDWCRELQLGRTAEDVATSADTFRLVFAITRKTRRDKGRPRFFHNCYPRTVGPE